ALHGCCPGLRAAAVLRLRVRGAERVRRPARRARPAARGRIEFRRPQGVRSPLGALRALPDRGPGRLRRAGGADPAGARSRRSRSRLRARHGISGRGRGRSARRPGARSRGVAGRPRAVPLPRGREARAAAARRPDPRGRPASPAHPDRGRARGARPMARIVVAGAGAAGASVAYHLAELGAEDVVLCDRGTVAGGTTAKAMGGVRQQFSTAAEVRLAQASIRFFEELGMPFFHQVGYLFLATTAEGLETLEARVGLQRSLGVPVERASVPESVRGDDVLAAYACWQDGLADPPAVARELVRRAAQRGVKVREKEDAASLDADAFVIACG